MTAKVKKMWYSWFELKISVSTHDVFYLKKMFFNSNHWKGPEIMTYPVIVSPLSPRLWCLSISKKNQGSWEKWGIPGLGQERYKTNVGLDLHFSKLNSLFSFARGYRTKRRACQGGVGQVWWLRCAGMRPNVCIWWCCGAPPRCPCKDWESCSFSCLDCWWLTVHTWIFLWEFLSVEGSCLAQDYTYSGSSSAKIGTTLKGHPSYWGSPTGLAEVYNYNYIVV